MGLEFFRLDFSSGSVYVNYCDTAGNCDAKTFSSLDDLEASYPQLSFIENVSFDSVVPPNLSVVLGDGFKDWQGILVFVASSLTVNSQSIDDFGFLEEFSKIFFKNPFSLEFYIVPAPQGGFKLDADTLKQVLKEVLEDENSDLIRVVKDCPYIPIRSLDGKDGAIYGDGETITLNKLGRTFKVLGSFHIVRDTDLNLTTCYALGIEKEPSLIVPEPVLKSLKGDS